MSATILKFPISNAAGRPLPAAIANTRQGVSQLLLREIAYAYLTDPLSEHHKNRYVTQRAYYNNIRRPLADLGEADLDTLTVREIKEAHARWATRGRLSMAHSLVTILRIVVGFGAGILEDAGCQRIRGAMSAVSFPNAKPREMWMTAEQAAAIRDIATINGDYCIALAQACQWDWAFRQKDIIGEWVPHWDPRPSQLVVDDLKWVGGVTVEQINADLVLRHKTSKRGKVLTIPLRSCPMVMEEIYHLPKSGPLIIDWETGQPFRSWTYRRRWRDYATKAGVPKGVWNMDTRAGRITTILAKGIPLEDARKLAGHSQSTTTSRYSRGDEQAIARSLERALEQDAA